VSAGRKIELGLGGSGSDLSTGLAYTTEVTKDLSKSLAALWNKLINLIELYKSIEYSLKDSLLLDLYTGLKAQYFYTKVP
jgi:hypothetical protein